MLAGLGMPTGAEEVYLALVDRQSATTAELASHAGLTVDKASQLLDWLRAQGLVLRENVLAQIGDDDARWAADDPERALRALLLRYEEGLLDVRGRLPGLQERFRLSRRAGDVGGVIEQFDTWQEVGDRYHRLLRDATSEVLMWDMAPYASGKAGPAEQAALDRRVTFRQLCDPQDFSEEVRQWRSAVPGLQVRIHSDLPFRGAIADRAAAVITMDHAIQNAKALFVRSSPLLDGLVMLFETCWSRAVPTGRDASGLSAEDTEVLRLLAAGLKDEAIARQVGITTRTVRRRAQAVLVALQARSRFHAGVEATRRGWV